MKSTVYLVRLEEKGFVNKISKDGIWNFTKDISQAKKYSTILGAFVRLDESKKIDELKNLKGVIVIEECSSETDDSPITSTIIGELVYKLNTDKRVIPDVPKEERFQLDEGVDPKPKKGRGRPRKEKLLVNKKEELKKPINEKLLVNKKEELEIVVNDLNITIVKASTTDSFWD